MFRLRIALGLASSLVALAALTIVFAGTGEAQGNQKSENVVVTNTPLPVTGNVNVANLPLPVAGSVTATIPGVVNVTGNVNAAVTGDVNASVTGQVTVNNPSNNPVLIRNVDAQSAKQLWQNNLSTLIANGTSSASVVFDPVPPGKVLVIEHINLLLTDSVEPEFLLIENQVRFGGGGGGTDVQVFVPQALHGRFIVDAATKFYVPAGASLRARVERFTSVGNSGFGAIATGYMVDYP